MLSRAAKSLAQQLNRRGYHISTENFKGAFGSTEVGSLGSKAPQQGNAGKLKSATAPDILPFKNLKFNNITSGKKQTLSTGTGTTAVAGGTGEGNVRAIDPLQARTGRRAAGNLWKTLPKGPPYLSKRRKGLARENIIQQVARLATALRLFAQEQGSAMFMGIREKHARKWNCGTNTAGKLLCAKKDKVDDVKAKLMDLLGRINKKLDDLKCKYQARAKTQTDKSKEELAKELKNLKMKIKEEAKKKLDKKADGKGDKELGGKKEAGKKEPDKGAKGDEKKSKIQKDASCDTKEKPSGAKKDGKTELKKDVKKSNDVKGNLAGVKKAKNEKSTDVKKTESKGGIKKFSSGAKEKIVATGVKKEVKIDLKADGKKLSSELKGNTVKKDGKINSMGDGNKNNPPKKNLK